MSVDAVEMIPSAKRLIRSLRDMGYEFAAAVADLVDNSIEARANTVRIDVVWAGENSRLTICDNGIGMAPAQLREALRYGSSREYDADDLGKFGLGLKTASMSQCCRLTVASRQNAARVDISAYRWDLDHIEATNRWEIIPVKSQALPEEAHHHFRETTGTVVIWERLDRILDYRLPDGRSAQKHLLRLCREVEEHLAMVFHRFLSGEVRGRRLAIYLNNRKITPWDPFARGEQYTEALAPVEFKVEAGPARSAVTIRPYILPPQSRFSSPQAHLRASGPGKWNRQQGFYIYRAGRMIQSGGWCGLRTVDEHLKLARIALDFSPKLDDEFRINVPKMRVSLPAAIRDDVLNVIAPVLRLANSTYRSGEKSPVRPATPPLDTGTAFRISCASEASSLAAAVIDHATVDESVETVGGNSIRQMEPATKATLFGAGITAVHIHAPRVTPETFSWHREIGFDIIESLLTQAATPDELPVVRRVVTRLRAALEVNGAQKE